MDDYPERGNSTEEIESLFADPFFAPSLIGWTAGASNSITLWGIATKTVCCTLYSP